MDETNHQSVSVPCSEPATLQSVAQPTVTLKPAIAPCSVGPPKKRPRTQPIKNVVDKQANRFRSEAWHHFTIIKDSDPMRAACNYCGKTYAGNPSTNGTTNFFKHLHGKCAKVPWKKEKAQTQITDYPTALPKTNNFKALDVNNLRVKVARMVIIDELPFRMVEGRGFRELMEDVFEGRFKVPSRVTVARDCMKLYIEERKKLKKTLKNCRVCLTTDTWTSLQNVNYMVLTVHYVDDDWVLQRKILNFCVIDSHKGAMIASRLEDCLNGWGIEKVLTLTVDNASSNDLCVQELLKDFKFKDVLLDNMFFHMRCSAHILNLVVKDGLKEHFSSIVRVRNACKYVKSSPARGAAFKKCVEKEKIGSSYSVILDIDTRWNSTYFMLDRAEKFKKAFDRLNKCDRLFQDFFDCYEYVCNDGNPFGKRKQKKVIGPPKKEDWQVARNFVAFLQLFYEVTLKFSSTKHVTSNICVPELCKVKQSINVKKMGPKSDSTMFYMAMSMSAKYDKYWSNWSNINHFLFVAIIFDPRFKVKGLEVWLRKLFGLDFETKKANIENHLNELFVHYSVQSSLGQPSNSQPKSRGSSEFEGEDIFAMATREMGEDDTVNNNSELALYLSDALVKDDGLDVLGWWKSNSSKYPILANIAKDILAIPVSTVASEQSFSTSGRVIDAFRSSLHPKTVEALVCAQNWLCGTGIPVDIMEELDEADKYEAIAQESSSSCITTVGEEAGIEVNSD